MDENSKAEWACKRQKLSIFYRASSLLNLCINALHCVFVNLWLVPFLHDCWLLTNNEHIFHQLINVTYSFRFFIQLSWLVDWNIQLNVAVRKLEPIPLSQKCNFFYEICTIGYNAKVSATKWWIKNANTDPVMTLH